MRIRQVPVLVFACWYWAGEWKSWGIIGISRRRGGRGAGEHEDKTHRHKPKYSRWNRRSARASSWYALSAPLWFSRWRVFGCRQSARNYGSVMGNESCFYRGFEPTAAEVKQCYHLLNLRICM